MKTLYIDRENNLFEIVSTYIHNSVCSVIGRKKGTLISKYYSVVEAIEKLKKLYTPDRTIECELK